MYDCEKCSQKKNASPVKSIPYIVHESEMSKAERRAKHMLFVLIISTSAMLLSNLAWLIAWVA